MESLNAEERLLIDDYTRPLRERLTDLNLILERRDRLVPRNYRT
jgi:hypothetical protein